jgi:DNA-binding FadR family transcriptional regulator
MPAKRRVAKFTAAGRKSGGATGPVRAAKAAVAPVFEAEAIRQRIPKTAEIVANQIRRKIVRGELKEGDFLPLEGELMATFRISRPTLREAFRVLENERLITIMRGSRSGAEVHRPKVDSVSRYAGFVLQAQETTIADIYDARLAIEPFAVRRLAEAHSPETIDRLNAMVARLEEMTESARYVDFMIAIADFHRLVVELSGNRTLLFLSQMLQDVLARHQVETFKHEIMPEAEMRRQSRGGIRSFRRLIDLIVAGEASAAEAHWRLHLVNANASWVPARFRERVIDVLG